MKEINSTINHKLTAALWMHMYAEIESKLGKRNSAKTQLEIDLHNKLEDRIKFKVMIPLNWRMNTSL